MRQIPVDVSKLQILVGGPTKPVLTPDGQQRRDAGGRPLFALPVIALVEDGIPETFVLRVPTVLPEMAPLTPLRLTGLVARPWSMGDRNGITFSCANVQAAQRT